jgi:fructokinase
VITVVGETLVDLIEDPTGQVDARPGGSAANVAVALARLGHPTSLLTHLGGDAHGRLVRDHLDASGVRLAPGTVIDGPRTSTARTTIDSHGQADVVKVNGAGRHRVGGAAVARPSRIRCLV